jgi:ankyrin repeat protein/nucleoside phosphorylase
MRIEGDGCGVSQNMLKRKREDPECQVPQPSKCTELPEEGNVHIHKTSTQTLLPHNYTVGWICALPLEMAAASVMLDEIHGSPDKLPLDSNTYTLGNINGHSIVIACLPSGIYGTTSATIVASQMKHSFRSIEFWLMVGIGGGAPSASTDIRLGDVVISVPQGEFDGVVQYDYGKMTRNGLFIRTGALTKPPLILLTAVSKLRSENERDGSQVPAILSRMQETHPQMWGSYTFPSQEEDILFQAEYEHGSGDTCAQCDRERLVLRDPRSSNAPNVHYGLIASGNQVIKHGVTRTRLTEELGILCFEMEAAGLMNNFPCIVVRGICDYCDSHKNKKWQRYAAATAAAYAKELLFWVPTISTTGMASGTEDIHLTQRQSLMEALKFEQMDDRRTTIKTAHAKTCRWLLSAPEYTSWLNLKDFSQHNGFFWLKGKAGSGKSTLMKFALQDTQKTMGQETIIVSFFFNARGENLEKTTLGMYRSLLFQLLEKAPELQSHLLSRVASSTLHRIDQGAWTIEILEDLCYTAIQGFERQCLIFFIDALDECDEDNVRDMVEFFENLSKLGILAQKRLHICFSSRHYPHITIEKGQQLVLEELQDHEQDISQYLNSELKIGRSKQAEEIKCDILERASGIFLWVVLTVQILKKEYDRGRIHQLRRRLQEIPTKLSDLFKDILTRDTQNIKELLLSLQWILYAERPLKREELYFAVLSADPEDLSCSWNLDDITRQDMDRFILSSTKGLAEVTKSKHSTVQFIHESVRDFLLKETGLNTLWAEYHGDLTDSSHDPLKSCCYNYMQLDVRNELSLSPKLPRASTPEAAKLRQIVTETFPFLEYAVQNVLYHAENAEKGGVSQEGFIANFALKKWIEYNNLLEKHHVRRYTSSASLLYIFSERNFPHLIESELRKISNIDIEGERYCYPIWIALASRNNNAIRALLSEQQRTHDHQVLNSAYAILVERGHEFKPRKGQTLLSFAAEYNHLPIVHSLITTGRVDINPVDSKDRRTPLSWAAESGHEAIAKLLIDSNADLEIMSYSGRTALTWAAKNGHKTVVKLLLDKGANIEAKNQTSQRTPLLYAAEYGRDAVVKLLLDNGADIESSCNSGLTPLAWAALNGHEAVARLLIDWGANLESKDNSDNCISTPLSWAAMNGHEAVVKLLIYNNVDLEPQDADLHPKGSTWTPLSRAAARGHEAIVRLLVDKGADIEPIGGSGETPLSWAAENGYEPIVKFLIDIGANLDSKSRTGETPLSFAKKNGHESIVKLLVDKGATLTLKNNSN